MVMSYTNDIKKPRIYMMYRIINVAVAEYVLFTLVVLLLALLLNGDGNGVDFRRLRIMLFNMK